MVEAKKDELYDSIRIATYGIAFFATPHRGGNFTKFGDVAASIARACLRNPRNTFIESLKKDSLLNDELEADFRHQSEDFQFLSFYETLPLGPIGLVCRPSVNNGMLAKLSFLR